MSKTPYRLCMRLIGRKWKRSDVRSDAVLISRGLNLRFHNATERASVILLYSFEGTTFRYSDNNDGDTPISMPNIEVKPIGAESTWLEAAWKDRTLLNKETHHRDVMSFFSVLSYQAAKRFIVLNWL